MSPARNLMPAADMRALLIERRKKQAEEAAQIAGQEAERRKVWAAEQLAPMLNTLMGGSVHEDSHECEEEIDADAIVDLARSLGYEANVDLNDEEDAYYAVVKAPSLETNVDLDWRPLVGLPEGVVVVVELEDGQHVDALLTSGDKGCIKLRGQGGLFWRVMSGPGPVRWRPRGDDEPELARAKETP